MSYNVGNLFDTVDDPQRLDEEFTPDGDAKWTESKLKAKMTQLSKVVLNVKNPSGQKCPDFLGLIEVENASIAQRFNREHLAECKYDKIVVDPKDPDPRGIRVVSLTRLPLVGKPISHSAYPGARFIQEVTVKVAGHPLTVFLNHWKSRRVSKDSSDDGTQRRVLSAKKLRARVSEILETNRDAEILMMGDFNDEPENKSLKEALGSTFRMGELTEIGTKAIAWNPAIELLRVEKLRDFGGALNVEKNFQKIRSTYYYARNSEYLLLDNFHLSRGLLDDEGLKYIPHTFQVVRLKEFTDKKLAPIPFYPPEFEGASDHFPILLRIAATDDTMFE